MADFTKSEKRVLRELSGTAYERELDGPLQALDAAFARWRSGEIHGSELSAKIHEFHNGDGRHLWKTYNSLDAPMLVSRAVAKGLLGDDEIPGEIRDKLERQIQFFEEHPS